MINQKFGVTAASAWGFHATDLRNAQAHDASRSAECCLSLKFCNGGRPFPAADHHPASRRDVATCASFTGSPPNPSNEPRIGLAICYVSRLTWRRSLAGTVPPSCAARIAITISYRSRSRAATSTSTPNSWRCTGREFRWVRHGPTSGLRRCRAGLACFRRRGPRAGSSGRVVGVLALAQHHPDRGAGQVELLTQRIHEIAPI